MSTVSEKMTALANEVRELSGTTESKTIDDMTFDVEDANEVITSQALLISSIKSAIDNLPNAIPEDQYKDSTDLVVDGAKVITPAGYYPSDAEKSVKTTNVTPPTFTIRADEEESEIVVRASNIQSEGYVPTTTRYDDAFVALTIDGDTATMSCGGQSIVRKMEGGGTSLETSAVSVQNVRYFYYVGIDENGKMQNYFFTGTGGTHTFNIVKGTLFFLEHEYTPMRVNQSSGIKSEFSNRLFSLMQDASASENITVVTD